MPTRETRRNRKRQKGKEGMIETMTTRKERQESETQTLYYSPNGEVKVSSPIRVDFSGRGT